MLSNWCKENKMKIHVGKTKAMLFRTRYQKCCRELHININGQIIENVNQFKYLGLVINQSLSFEEHYEKTCRNMTNRLHLLKRYKKYFSEKWRLIFATSLILSLLEYCLPVWGKLNATKSERLNKIIIRTANSVVLNNAKSTKTCEERYEVLEKLNWLTVEERLIVYSLNFVKKNILCETSSLKDCFPSFQQKSSSQDSEEQVCLRNEKDFIVPRMRTEFGKSTFYYRTIQMWNQLPAEVKEIQIEEGFDYRLRQHILKDRTNIYQYF
ncbi:unnamed protein product [Orchesella dallaii]|uniref:RNA-directed DNA polymerase from mobile element jockey n=1 Tax=Orchesella dallaii TaxID=48710 RepID=A0ABP1Q426_9HEXA